MNLVIAALLDIRITGLGHQNNTRVQHSTDWSIQSINQSVNQSINQTIIQMIHQSINLVLPALPPYGHVYVLSCRICFLPQIPQWVIRSQTCCQWYCSSVFNGVVLKTACMTIHTAQCAWFTDAERNWPTHSTVHAKKSIMMYIDWSQLPQFLQCLTDCQDLPQSLSSFSSNVTALNTAV